MPLPLEDLAAAAPLFSGQENTMVRSCLQGVMGGVYATADRDAAAAVLGDFCFLAGKPNEWLITKDYGRDLLILVPSSEEWASRIEALYPLSRPRKRFAFRKEAEFDTEKLKALADALPSDCQLRQIDAECYRKCLCQPWSRDLVSNYPTWEEYEKLGLGFVVLQNGEILSGASAYSRCREGIEIEIDTREDHRRQGLAAACASALILRCLEMGLFPSWDAHNPASAALAEKLGYTAAGSYTAYEVVPEKSGGLRIVSLGQHPERFRDAAQWFSSKWGVPEQAYLESMASAQTTQTGVPAWYEVQTRQGQRIAGLGVIENDFHKRPDLTPNLCALYVEEPYRKRGLARALLDHACRELHRHGIQDAYLITSHTRFYEKCGWEYFGDIEENDGGQIRMYHRRTTER